MECPGCKSKKIQHVGQQPFSTLQRYKCLTCYQDFLASQMFIPGNVLNPDSFKYGIPHDELKICPGCGNHSCYWIGIGPSDIECAEKYCKFYKPYTKDNRIKYSSDKSYEDSVKEEKEAEAPLDDDDTKEIDPMDFSDMLGTP